MANTDMAGIISDNYNQRLSAAQQPGNPGQGIGSGLLGAASHLTWSDRRLKRDIGRVGRTTNGLNIYRYRYKSGEPIHLALMAQEVERSRPEAVARDASGMRMVDLEQATK